MNALLFLFAQNILLSNQISSHKFTQTNYLLQLELTI